MKGSLVLILIVVSFFVGKYYLPKYKAEKARSVAPITAYIPREDLKGGPMVSFNFDDGYLSAYKVGMSIIEGARFKATYYIAVDLIGERGYMSRKQVLDLQTRGHEIGSHTLTHVNLTKISTKDAWDEISGSKQALFDIGVARTETFSYPNGYFNDEVINLVKEAGFRGARITNPGLNDASVDPYKLFYLGMNTEVTFEQAKNKIDDAILKKKWLIMVFHKVDESGFENVSSDFLQKVVSYIKEKNVPVVTNAQGLYIVKNILH